MKNIVLFAAFLITTTSIFSQQNTLGLHLVPAVFGELRVGYERQLTENISIGLSGGYFIQHKIPNFIFDEEPIVFDGGTVEIQNSMEGYDVIPELRRYIGKSEGLEGFYLGVYGKYAHYEFEMMDVVNYQFTPEEYDDLDPEIQDLVDENSMLDVNILMNSNLSQFGLGFQMGYQVMLGKRFFLDVNFLGLEIDRTVLNASIISPNVPVDYSSWIDEMEQASEDWDRWPFVEELEFESIRNGIEVNARGYIPWYKGGFRLGFVF